MTKTDTPTVVPLARQGVAILREVHPLTGHGRYVFPNARYPHRERPMSHATLWIVFRAMARTILDEALGFRPDFIAHQLAHRVRDPNGRAYNRTAFLPERRHLMQVWADYLDRLKAGEEIKSGTYGAGASHTPTALGIRGRQLRTRPSWQPSRASTVCAACHVTLQEWQDKELCDPFRSRFITFATRIETGTVAVGTAVERLGAAAVVPLAGGPLHRRPR